MKYKGSIKEALRYEDWDAIFEMVKSGASPNFVEAQYGNRPLAISALLSQKYAFVNYLIDKELIDPFVEWNWKGNYIKGQTLLVISAFHGNKPLVEKLLSKNPSKQNINNAFRAAVFSDKTGSMMKLLIEHGADVNQKNEKGNSLFHELVMHGASQRNQNALRNLKRVGADIDAKNNEGQTAFHLCVKMIHNRMTKNEIKILRDLGCDMKSSDNQNMTPSKTAKAADKDDCKIVHDLIKSKENLNSNQGTYDGKLNDTIIKKLEYAIFINDYNGFEKIVKSLDDKSKIFKDKKWINSACDQHSEEITNFLIDNCDDLFYDIMEENDPLSMRIVSNGWMSSTKKIIDKNIDINAESKNGSTFLMFAAKTGNVDIVNLFLNNNVRVDKINDQNESALTIASSILSDDDVGILLVKKGAKKLLNIAKDLSLKADNVKLNEIITDRIKSHEMLGFPAVKTKNNTKKNSFKIPKLKNKSDNHNRDLYMALKDEDVRACDVLIKKGKIDFNEIDSNGSSFLNYAAYKGMDKTCKELVAMGMDKDQVNKNNETPILAATKRGKIDAVLYFLSINVNLFLTPNIISMAINPTHGDCHPKILKAFMNYNQVSKSEKEMLSKKLNEITKNVSHEL